MYTTGTNLRGSDMVNDYKNEDHAKQNGEVGIERKTERQDTDTKNKKMGKYKIS